MNNDILDFLQAIQQSDTIPDISPVFSKPFELLKELDYTYKGFIDANPSLNLNLFERWVGNVKQQLSVYYDIEEDYAYVDYTAFHQQGMNIIHILNYNESRLISSKEIIPTGAANYCKFSYYYEYKDDSLVEIFFRHRSSPTTLPEINIESITINNDIITAVKFVYFGMDDCYPEHSRNIYKKNKLLFEDLLKVHHDKVDVVKKALLEIHKFDADSEYIDVTSNFDIQYPKEVCFSNEIFKCISEIDIEKHTVDSLLAEFPISLTKEQESLILMSTI